MVAPVAFPHNDHMRSGRRLVSEALKGSKSSFIWTLTIVHCEMLHPRAYLTRPGAGTAR